MKKNQKNKGNPVNIEIINKYRNKIIQDDCITLLNNIKEPFVDLIFADPPFNIGYKYDKYSDTLEAEEYKKWTLNWMTACYNILKNSGSFYVAIGDEHVIDVKLAADELNLKLRNWIIWHYSFGQQTKKKFARAHTHILYFAKNEVDFVFNDDAARIISDRQKNYKDKRANLSGKMPDDVWDEYPRICGTFNERNGWHPCQMPESLLARIIRVSSKERDWILDPFSGSGTTCVVAHKLNRIFTGIEISKDYVKKSSNRIKRSKGLPIEGEKKYKWNKHLDDELKWLYHENKIPTDQLIKDPFLVELFTAKFNNRVSQDEKLYSIEDISTRLLQLRKSAKLGPLKTTVTPLRKQEK